MSFYKVDDNGNPILETPKSVIANDADANTTGAKLSYTVPSNTKAVVKAITLVINSGTPTVLLELVRGATTIVLRSLTASIKDEGGYCLEAGDIIRLNVSVAGGMGSTIDASISALEYPA